MYSQLQLTGQKKWKRNVRHSHRGHSGMMSTCPSQCSVDFTYLLLLLQHQGAKSVPGTKTPEWEEPHLCNSRLTNWCLNKRCSDMTAAQQTVNASLSSPSQMTTDTVWGDSRHISTQRSSSACHTLEQLSSRFHWQKFWNAKPLEPLNFLLLFNRDTWYTYPSSIHWRNRCTIRLFNSNTQSLSACC